ASKRYTILVADRRTGVVRRFTLSLRPAIVAATVLALIPSLVALGAVTRARWEAEVWEAQRASLVLENESMRVATGALAEQVDTLQTAIDDIDAFRPSDAEAAAMARLPKRVRQRALGGAEMSPALLQRLNGPSATPDGMGVLRQILGTLASELESAKPQIARQAALA